MNYFWTKTLQTVCGFRGHEWYKSESCGRKVRYCRRCGKMETFIPKGEGNDQRRSD